jgi:hypothetical protein
MHRKTKDFIDSPFGQKIAAIIKDNPYLITSVSGLEIFCKTGTGSVLNAIKRGEEPSIRVMRKVLRSLHITTTWWENPIGPPFPDDRAMIQAQSITIQEQEQKISDLNLQVELMLVEIERCKERLERVEQKTISIRTR